MAKEEPLKFEGQVVTIHPGDKFDVKLDQNDHVVKCTLSGKMRKNSIKVILRDKVSIEMSPYDLGKGRITFRHK
ncbi:MAG: translation initiation factor IF-1 [Candidatus Endolissoclinum sp.]|jgi:translation initiation factor IF-1|nr:translation initiation factor IF-1 [Candidatus Endolissoclinum sp.]|tara:strand:+ start:433 stop:654 length:222 start_codon:yes stop_codon:yes gene_type:complete